MFSVLAAVDSVGTAMFFVRSLAWLTAVLLLLPPTADGQPAPRVNFLHAAYSTKVLLQDISGACERNPQACATTRATLAMLQAKIETGASILSAGMAAGQALSDPNLDHGTLDPTDLEPAWSLADTRH
jgi:hypothetical protein